MIPDEDGRMTWRAAKDQEARGIIDKYQFHHSTDDGPKFLNPTNPTEVIGGIFSGPRLGEIVHCHFGVHSSLLHRYDQELRLRELPTFSASVSWASRMDFCIFTCDPGR